MEDRAGGADLAADGLVRDRDGNSDGDDVGEDADAAEEALAAYQADPDGWSQRLPNNNSMAVVGAGWYHEALSFGTQD